MEREELLKTPEYWTTKAQFDLYAHAEDFMRQQKMNRKMLAEFLGVSKGYVSQLLNGEYDHKLSNYIRLAIAFGYAPVVTFIPLDQIMTIDKRDYQPTPLWKKFQYQPSDTPKTKQTFNYNIDGFTPSPKDNAA